MTSELEAHIRAFYEAIDEDRYEKLRSLLGTGFAHDRPDRTLEGAEEFVRFMREDRPKTETTHEIDRIYRHGTDAAAQGRLLDDANDETLFAFVDVHSIADGRTTGLRTYTD